MNDFAGSILYAEDFGREAVVVRRPPPPPPMQAPAPKQLTQADIDAACIRAVQAAETAWSDSAAERRAEALTLLSAGLQEVRQDAVRQAEAMADELARTVLGLVSAVLPEFCRAHGDAEVRTLVARLAPLIARSGRLVIRVHPGMVAMLAEDVALLDEHASGNVELRPANLQPGDVRLSWEDGSLVRDTAAIRAALQDGLAQFGLTHAAGHTPAQITPTEITPAETRPAATKPAECWPLDTRTGSLAHAQ